MKKQVKMKQQKSHNKYFVALGIIAALVIVGGNAFGVYMFLTNHYEKSNPTDRLIAKQDEEDRADVEDLGDYSSGDEEEYDFSEEEYDHEEDEVDGFASIEGGLSGTTGVTIPVWAESLNYLQKDKNSDYKLYGTHEAGGLIAVTTAIKILKNNQSLTPKDVYKKVKSNVKGSVMSGSDGLYWWALRNNAPRLYGLTSAKLFYDNLNSSKISSMKSHLQKGHMIVANSAKGYFLKTTGGKTTYRSNHTIMFYKFKDNKYWAKDSAESAASIGYTEKNLYQLFRNNTTNSVWWFGKVATSSNSGSKNVADSSKPSQFPDWVEKLKYTQGSHAQDKKNFGIEQACGVISMTTAIKILKNDQKLTPNQVAAKIKKEVKGGIMPNTGGSPYWWAIRKNTPRLYGLTSGELFTGNLNNSKINSMKSHLQKGHMIVAHSQKGNFLKKTGGKAKYHGSHTIMFYKYQDSKYWAKDSAGGAAAIGYTTKDLQNLFRNGTINSVWWVGKK